MKNMKRSNFRRKNLDNKNYMYLKNNMTLWESKLQNSDYLI